MKKFILALAFLSSFVLAEPIAKHLEAPRELEDRQSCTPCGTDCCYEQNYYSCGDYGSLGYMCYYNPPAFITSDYSPYPTSYYNPYTTSYYNPYTTSYYYPYETTTTTSSDSPEITWPPTENNNVNHYGSSSSKSAGKGKIAGAAVGAVVAVAAIVGALIACLRRRMSNVLKKKQTQPQTQPQIPVSEYPVTTTTVYPKQAE